MITTGASSPLLSAIREKRNVMSAVILRDMRTRFFDHGLGFLVVAIWPLVHMLALLAISAFSGRLAPFGESMNVFFATGLIPTLAFMYISRFMSMSLILNRPMLSFPVVTVIDIMFARAFLEIVAAFITLFSIILILWFMGDNPFPNNPEQAVLCYISTLILAVGLGSLAGVITMFFQVFATIYALMMIGVYISSGTMFVTANLPESIANALSWNPVNQCVEWMRSAYYEGYDDRFVSKTYLVSFGIGCLFLGLLLERVHRRRMLEG